MNHGQVDNATCGVLFLDCRAMQYRPSCEGRLAERLNYAPRFTVADLFCGAGGLSLGFDLARRFDVIYGSDINKEAAATFQTNHAVFGGVKPAVEVEDIRKLDADAVLAKTRQHGVRKAGDLDCLIGGPPCEGFSQNRTVREGGGRTHKFIDDPRNILFRWFVGLAAKLRPKIVLIENVPDLIRHRDGKTRDEVLSALDAAGYAATARILNAADYGVPQMRRRAFFLAQRKDDLEKHGIRLEFPQATHRPYPMMHESLISREDWLPGDSGYWVSLREALADLPTPTDDDDYDHTAVEYPSATLTTFRALMRSPRGVPYNHLARKLGKGGLVRLRALRPGQTCAELPAELRPKGFYHFSYTRGVWSEPARTITKFCYHVGSGRFGHPDEDRALTTRECARLQSFPDDFRFLGTSEIRRLSALVGSAVPPLLGMALARQVAQYLDAIHLANMAPTARSEARLLKGDAVVRRLEKENWTNGKSHRKEQIPLEL